MKRHPGRVTDFRPYIIFITASVPDDESSAIKTANRLKNIDIPAGAPIIISLSYGDADESFMRAVASNEAFFRSFPDASSLVKIFPAVGTVAGSKTGEEAMTAAIMNL